MGLIPDDFILMPVDDDETYVSHVYLVVLLWTAFVIVAGVTLALIAL
jgi:hypothetical protein